MTPVKKLKDKSGFRSFVMSANRRNVAINISKEQFQALASRPCHLCGSTDSVSVARKNSNVEFTVGNVIPACTVCLGYIGGGGATDLARYVKTVYGRLFRKEDERGGKYLRAEPKARAIEVNNVIEVDKTRLMRPPWGAAPDAFMREAEGISSEDEEDVEEFEYEPAQEQLPANLREGIFIGPESQRLKAVERWRASQ